MKIDGSEYYPRIIDPVVDAHLAAFGAIEIAGTMWSGKTWTSRAHGKSRISLDEPQVRSLAELDVQTVLAGEQPHIIDEWQEVPTVWDAVRTRVDAVAGERGLFILTGSSRPSKDKTHHTGSGRISQLRMLPMSLTESKHSKATVSLSGLFDGEFESGPVATDLFQLATHICRGGWPGALALPDEEALLVPTQYINALVSKDDANAPGNVRELRSALRSIARNVGSDATLKTLAKDMRLDVSGLASDTATRRVRSFIDYLLSRYIIYEQGGWDAPIKSPQRLRVKPRHRFADPSLPASLLGASPERLLGNLQLFDQLFEELCLRDLSVYTSAMKDSTPDSLRYYRDADGLEVDAIIELRDGRWGAIEIKLGANKADEGERNLLRLKNKVAANPAARNPDPSFLLVLVGKTDYKYRTPNGVFVAPVTELTI